MKRAKRRMRIADLSTPSDDRQPDGLRYEWVLLEWGGVGQIFLGESRSRLYPHMRAKFGRCPTAVSKKVSFKCISRWLKMYRFSGHSSFRVIHCYEGARSNVNGDDVWV